MVQLKTNLSFKTAARLCAAVKLEETSKLVYNILQITGVCLSTKAILKFGFYNLTLLFTGRVGRIGWIKFKTKHMRMTSISKRITDTELDHNLCTI